MKVIVYNEPKDCVKVRMTRATAKRLRHELKALKPDAETTELGELLTLLNASF